MRQDTRYIGFLTVAIVFVTSGASAQGLNKVVFGPMEGDDAGVLTVRNGQAKEIEMWVRTDPDNPAPIMGVLHSLMSADSIIFSRDGAVFDPDYNYPCWDTLVSRPFGPDDDPDIPEGHTVQNAGGLLTAFDPPCYPLDTDGEWDYYGSFLMTCNSGVPVDETYYPLSAGWFPHSGQGTSWAFEIPPGGSITPLQEFCGLYFAPPCEYVPGDCNCNGTPLELADVVDIIAQYRGMADVCYTCFCPPHGEDFPPQADPDGNCVALELSDVICMFSPWFCLSSCPDCPQADSLDSGGAGFVPVLKSKVGTERGQIKNESLK
jgi:hypothetical protein